MIAMPHSIQQVAEQLLFGKTLQDKLVSFQIQHLLHPTKSETTDVSSTVFKRPELPGRPPELAFSEKERVLFPKNFEDCNARGIAMHFFANHELLAIELMALCLLRFPHSPQKFQKGLLAIIKEEQEHLQLYIEGAKRLGVALGTLPVNRFFWDALGDMKTPYEFIVGMGLTFEQANLDHAFYYMTEFRKVGDEDSARLLQQVYEDEIRHVRHANYWFQQWKKSDMSDFDNHQHSLSFPLTPARAIGKKFDLEGRIRSGLSLEYIEQLRVFRHSKGRVPDVYIFNMGCEFRLLFPSKSNLPKPIAQREEWWDLMMLPFVRDGDIIIVHQIPSTEHLQQLQKAGFILPQFVLRTEVQKYLSHRKIAQIQMWGHDSTTMQLLHSPFQHKEDFNSRTKWNHYEVASKVFAKEILDSFVHEYIKLFPHLDAISGTVVRDISEVLTAIEFYQGMGFDACLGKANISSAGRGNKILTLPLDASMKGWLERTLQLQPIIIQPKLDKIADLSLQIYIYPPNSSKRYNNLGLTRFFTTPKGDYLGHHLGVVSQTLPKGSMRCLYEHQLLDKIVQHVVEALIGKCFYGFAGIDMILYKKRNGDIALQPLIEINPRYTMGHVALQVKKRICGVGRLRFLSPQQAKSREPEFKGNQLIGGILQLTSESPQIVCIDMCELQKSKDRDEL